MSLTPFSSSLPSRTIASEDGVFTSSSDGGTLSWCVVVGGVANGAVSFSVVVTLVLLLSLELLLLLELMAVTMGLLTEVLVVPILGLVLLAVDDVKDVTEGGTMIG